MRWEIFRRITIASLILRLHNLCFSYSFLGSTFSIVKLGVSVVVGVGVTGCRKAKFMHHPISFAAFPCSSSVVYQCLLESHAIAAFSSHRVYRFVDPSCFPKPRPCDSVGSHAVPILSPSSAKEVPFCVFHSATTCSCKKIYIPNEKEREMSNNKNGVALTNSRSFIV